MKCVYCGCEVLKVIDSRPVDETNAIRHRRECAKCGRRFTTYETVETMPLLVVKNSGNRQQFDPVKLKNGIIKSCEKRPVSAEKIDRLVEDIQKQLYNTLKSEISSKEIGELVMDGLKKIDEVAYIRFASVYRQFKDSNTFFEEMKKIFDEKEHKES